MNLVQIGAISLMLGGCCTIFPSMCENSTEAAFTAIKKCAGNRIQDTDYILYFGPTNAPIGTIYEKMSENSFDPTWRGSKIIGDSPSKDVVEPASFGTCSYAGKTSIDLGLAFGVNVDPIPVGGELSTDFKNSKVLSMNADSFGWETLYKGEYRKLMDANNSIHDDVKGKPNVYATIALLKVKGYRVKLDTGNQDSVALKAKYKDGPLPKGLTGDISADVKIAWTSDSTIELTIKDESTVGGVMRRVSGGKLEEAGDNDKIKSYGHDRQSIKLSSK